MTTLMENYTKLVNENDNEEYENDVIYDNYDNSDDEYEFKMLTNSGPGTGSEMSGAYTKITTNGSVPPQYQGYTVHTADGPFCFIPRN